MTTITDTTSPGSPGSGTVPGIGQPMSRDTAIAARYQLRCVTDRLDRTCSTPVSWSMPEREPTWVIGRPSPLLTDEQQAAVVAEYAAQMGVTVQTWPLTRGTVSLVATGSFDGGVTVQVVAEPLRDPNAPASPAVPAGPAPDPAEAAAQEPAAPHASGDDTGDHHDEGPAGGAK